MIISSTVVCQESYLDIKLKVALIHLPGNHTLDDLHWNQLEAVIGWAEDVVRLPLLDLQVQKPVSEREDITRRLKEPQ